MGTAIQALNQATIGPGSQVPFYDAANGGDARASVTALAAAIGALLGAASLQVTQYAAPNASGFTVQIAPPTAGASVWLVLTPLAAFAAGTLVLPPVPVHGQEVLVSSTQAVAALTVNPGANTVNGAPAALAANGFFRFKFDGVLSTWYRIG